MWVLDGPDEMQPGAALALMALHFGHTCDHGHMRFAIEADPGNSRLSDPLHAAFSLTCCNSVLAKNDPSDPNKHILYRGAHATVIESLN